MTGTNAFDNAVMAFVQEHFHNPATDAVFPVVTYLGEAGILWIVLSVILLFFKKTRRCGVYALTAIALGFLVGELGLKNIVCRPRPYQVNPPDAPLLIPFPGGYSFPSGHSASSFAVATVYFHFSKKWGVPALILAGLIAFSRVFLFVHWPTDVLAGAAFGVLVALLVLWLAPKLEAKRRADEEELDQEE